MKRKILLIVPILFLLSCAGRHPADIVAPAVMKGTDVYQGIEQKLVDLKNAGNPLVVNNWQKISDVRWKASTAYRKAWRAWYALSLVNNPQNLEEVNKQLLALADALIEMLAYVPPPEVPQFMVQINELKAEASK